MYQLKIQESDGTWTLLPYSTRVSWTYYNVRSGVSETEVEGALRGKWPCDEYHVSLVGDSGLVVKRPALIRLVYQDGTSMGLAINRQAYVMNPQGDTVDQILGGKHE